MTCAVVIRALNEERHIGRLLTGIGYQSVQPDEVVVVDSGSTDATSAIAQAFDAKVVSIGEHEFSFGRALNRGIEATECDLIVIASAHVYPLFEDWLERLLAPFDHESVAVSFGRQTVPLGGRFSERRLLAQWFPAESRHHPDDPFCNNANAAIRRSLWVGQPYDERLTGLEDLAWAKSAIARGFTVAYAADAPVAHVHDERFAMIVNRYRREAIAHREIYPGQTMGLGAAIRLWAANVAGDIAAAAREPRFFAHVRDALIFRTGQFYGTFKGFSQSGPVTETLKRRFYYPGSVAARPPPPEARPRGNAIDYDRLF
jgi:glycosyltransferase involved in cell wall biosynthesis